MKYAILVPIITLKWGQIYDLLCFTYLTYSLWNLIYASKPGLVICLLIGNIGKQ